MAVKRWKSTLRQKQALWQLSAAATIHTCCHCHRLLTSAADPPENRRSSSFFDTCRKLSVIYQLHFHAVESKLTLGADPPDLPVTATPLQLPPGAGPGHSHCHRCGGQRVHKGRLTSAWIQNRKHDAGIRVAQCVRGKFCVRIR